MMAMMMMNYHQHDDVHDDDWQVHHDPPGPEARLCDLALRGEGDFRHVGPRTISPVLPLLLLGNTQVHVFVFGYLGICNCK